MLGDRDPRDAGGDGLKLAADFQRRFGFQIERIEVRRPPVVVDEDARGRAALSEGAPRARARSQSDQRRPVNPSPPMRNTSRRLMPSHRRTRGPRIESIAKVPELTTSHYS
jgi:hypothetical protein